MAEEVKIIKAEIKYVFSTEAETKAIFKIKYSDGTIKTGDGPQSIEEANEFLESLKDNPIYEPKSTEELI